MKFSTPIIALLASVLLLAACVDKPAPWKPDTTATDLQGDSRGTSDAVGSIDQTGNPDVIPAADQALPGDLGTEASCTQSCAGKQCGPDGCGGQCGTCSAGTDCVVGQCVETNGTCDDGNNVNWDGCTEGYASEFQVNGETLDDQRAPAVAAVEDGFVVVWQSCDWDEWEASTEGHDGWGCGVFGRLVRPQGLTMGDEFPVNATIQYNQVSPDVATLGNDVVVSWLTYDSGDWQIKVRVFDAEGNPLSSEVVGHALDHEQQWHPYLATNGDNQILVAWPGITAEGGFGIIGEFFTWDGQDVVAVGEPVDLKQKPTVDTMFPRLTSLSTGDFLVAWGAVMSGDAYVESFAQLVTYPDGPTKAEFLLNSNGGDGGAQGFPDVAGFDGGFIAVYEDNSLHINGENGLAARLFGPGGTPSGDSKPLVISGPAVSLPVVTTRADGDFLVAYGTHFDDDEQPWLDGIKVMHVAADLTKDDPVPGNLHLTGYQKFARIASNSNTAETMVVWESCPYNQYYTSEDLPGQDGDGCGIFATVFND